MKKTLAAILALGALATAAAPAMAQPYGGQDRPAYGDRDPNGRGPGDRGPGDYRGPGDRGGNDHGGWGGVRARVDMVLAKVDRALHSDRLTRGERNSLSYRAAKLSNMQRQYERGGLMGWERASLEREANDLNARVDRAVRRY